MATNLTSNCRTTLAEDVAVSRAIFALLREAARLKEIGVAPPEVQGAAAVYEQVKRGLDRAGDDMAAYLFKYGHTKSVNFQTMKLVGLPDFASDSRNQKFYNWAEAAIRSPRTARVTPAQMAPYIAVHARARPIIEAWETKLCAN